MFTMVALVMFTTPIHVLRLADSGATAGEKRAIKREIDLAFGDSALNVAEGIVSTMKERAMDPSRKAELDRALAEIDRARRELSSAQAKVGSEMRSAAREAADAAHEAAVEVRNRRLNRRPNRVKPSRKRVARRSTNCATRALIRQPRRSRSMI